MTTTSIAIAIKSVAETAPRREVRYIKQCKVGTVPAHQGDVYLHRVVETWPRGNILGTRQIAVGDTQGSRHVAEGDGVTVYAGKNLPECFAAPTWAASLTPKQIKDIFLGPVIVADKRFKLTHPEHAYHCLPAGVYQVTYQADSRARARVQD
jgi:hypothetical protein